MSKELLQSPLEYPDQTFCLSMALDPKQGGGFVGGSLEVRTLRTSRVKGLKGLQY